MICYIAFCMILFIESILPVFTAPIFSSQFVAYLDYPYSTLVLLATFSSMQHEMNQALFWLVVYYALLVVHFLCIVLAKYMHERWAVAVVAILVCDLVVNLIVMWVDSRLVSVITDAIMIVLVRIAVRSKEHPLHAYSGDLSKL